MSDPLSELALRVEALEAMVKDLVLRSPTAPAAAPAAARARRGAAGRWLTVDVAGRRLGLPLDAVREVVRSAWLEPVPGGARALAGLLDLRGEPIEVVALRAVVGAPPLDDDLDARIVVVRAGDRAAGLEVDQAHGLVDVAAGAVEARPDLSAAGWLAGVVPAPVEGEPPLLLVDPARLLEALLAAGDEPLALPGGA